MYVDGIRHKIPKVATTSQTFEEYEQNDAHMFGGNFDTLLALAVFDDYQDTSETGSCTASDGESEHPGDERTDDCAKVRDDDTLSECMVVIDLQESNRDLHDQHLRDSHQGINDPIIVQRDLQDTDHCGTVRILNDRMEAHHDA